jgi:hypothetical protein
MKNLNQTLFCLALFLCVFACSVTTYCQVQEVSVRAPDNIKIDGKTLEWPNNKLKVFNNSKIFYMPMAGDMVNGEVLTSGPGVNPDYYFFK